MNLSRIQNPSGIILLNKAPGLTSFKTLGAVKKYFQTKKVGHAGTLDQFASGLMIVGVGDGTRLMSSFVGLDKVYEADIHFGTETSTLDPEGEVTATGDIPQEAELVCALDSFIGDSEQVPPRYSAIHIDGKRAYQRALSGEDFEVPSRKITIHSITFISWSSPVCRLRVHVSSGTYIRSFARDLAARLGTCAHLVALRRTSVGKFSIDDASDPQDMDKGFMQGIDLARSLGKTCILRLVPSRLKDFRNGKPLDPSWFMEFPGHGEFEKLLETDLPVITDTEFIGMVRMGRDGVVGYHHVFAKRAEP